MSKILLSFVFLFVSWSSQANFDLDVACGDHFGEIKLTLRSDNVPVATESLFFPKYFAKENETSESLALKLVQETVSSSKQIETLIHFFFQHKAFKQAFDFLKSYREHCSFKTYAQVCELFQALLKNIQDSPQNTKLRTLHRTIVAYCQEFFTPFHLLHKRAVYLVNEKKNAEALNELNAVSPTQYNEVEYTTLLCTQMVAFDGLKDAGQVLHAAQMLLSYAHLLPEFRARAYYMRLKYSGHMSITFDDCFKSALAHAQSFDDFARIYSLMKDSSCWPQVLLCVEKMLEIKKNVDTAAVMEDASFFNLYSNYCLALMQYFRLPSDPLSQDEMDQLIRQFIETFNVAKSHAKTREDHNNLSNMYDVFIARTLPL